MPRPLTIAVVGGPMYDALYASRLPAFTAETGIPVEIGARLIHAELNEHLDRLYGSRQGHYDLITTHTKYAPSQAPWLLPLDDLLPADALADFEPATVELARVDGALLGVPRNVDARLLHYRTDLLDDPREQRSFRARFGYDLAPPATWEAFADVARHFARPAGLYGFAFPGKESGLWGTFFELLAAAGGQMFGQDLRAAFVTPEGAWALGLLRDLYLTWQAAPPELPGWQFDTVSQAFQEGRVAMIADWPGTYASHASSPIGDRFDVALYPAGPAGRRVYSGGFTWAIPTSAADPAASLALLLFLTSAESQAVEAARGVLTPRRSVQQAVREAAASGSREARRLALLDETIATAMLVPPRFAAYPAVEAALWPALQQGITGALTVEEALAEAARRMDAVLQTDTERGGDNG